MKIGYRTTYIILDRGTEDIALLAELELLLDASRKTYKTYPYLCELRTNLRDEVDAEKEGK